MTANFILAEKACEKMKNIVISPSRTIHHNISSIYCLFFGFPADGSDLPFGATAVLFDVSRSSV